MASVDIHTWQWHTFIEFMVFLYIGVMVGKACMNFSATSSYWYTDSYEVACKTSNWISDSNS